jgi:uroporphyrinogen-III synthase
MAQVLVVRKFENFSRILAENGFTVINCPTIETVPAENLSDSNAKISALASYDGVFLTSRAAAVFFSRSLDERKIDFRGRVYVLGRSSLETLKDKNLDLVFVEKANTAREMLEAIPPEKLKNNHFLFIRGERSLGAVPDFLSKAATVEETIVYRTIKIPAADDKIKEIQEKAAAGEILCTCFFSPSGAESFLEQFGFELLSQTKIAAIGKTTADFLKRQNLTVDFTAPTATAEGFANGLIEYLKN